MAILHRASWQFVALLVACAAAPLAHRVAHAQEDKKPSLSLKANPPVGFSPLRVRLVVEVKGGTDDFQDFYCAGVVWAWGDGTESESSEDCEPYQPGVSAIKRRFSTEHLFRQAGNYRVTFRLKQRNKVVGGATVNVQVRAGVRDGFGD
jgi:hypothetical protein